MKKVIGLGNALVDIMIMLENEHFLAENNLPKGSMQLVDIETSEKINKSSEKFEKKLTSGGSAANTIQGLAKLGTGSSYIGKVSNDEYGNFFETKLKEHNINPVLLKSDTATGREKVLIKLSETAVNQNSDVQSYITSLKIKAVGDELASILDENAEQGKVKDATATFEILVTVAENVPAGTQFQAVIAGDILPEALNENGQAITNPVTDSIFSEIVEIDGAEAPTCSGTPEPVCGIESAEEAIDANHSTPELKSYANKCEFQAAGAELFDKGTCDAKDQEKYAKHIAEYTDQ